MEEKEYYIRFITQERTSDLWEHSFFFIFWGIFCMKRKNIILEEENKTSQNKQIKQSDINSQEEI